ncbi:endonuclease MutS2 [Campylobacter sp. 19-13652]|uniref:endonuclease MutS2 n=1 Tax=Campylobacter sp. 19-13652 TaxID=2840180 RepID=UPI001C7946E6|nr:endonuclease MutS2 [Campylobacter sp. 19-13652]BCX80016.1 endonuclease MutS2 [Campylobacter sp. 19-13652]
MKNELLGQLDLGEYLERFSSFLARQKELFIPGDSKIHFECILELSEHDFNPPNKIKALNDELMRLSKNGVLHVSEIYEFAKIISYFSYLKKLKFQGSLSRWLDKIILPEDMLQIASSFDKNGELKDEVDARLVDLRHALKLKGEEIATALRQIAYSKSLSSYLVDTQIHYINESETLLVRGGFNHVLKASIVARSSGGHFYVEPERIATLKREQSRLNDEKQMIIYEHAKAMSERMSKALAFLKFINGAFDIFDAYSARALMAKSLDLEFVLPKDNSRIVLKDFAHPALKNPKSISLDFSKKVLLITGVNAGGKSMLLKSIISAALMAKYLLPMRINARQSQIGAFKEFDAIIEDPQNVKNDISTFAGRMLHFSRLFSKRGLLIGIDEIELGTDFEEAASLYSVIIEQLIKNDVKIAITTHHKRLAMLLAKNDEVELVAALYDESTQRPKYEFLEGTIGKSYAFETAARYGIAQNLVAKAKELYGENKENLNELLTKTINLEADLKERIKRVQAKESKLDELISAQKEANESEFERTRAIVARLEREYNEAINEAKKAINLNNTKDKQRAINAANERKKSIAKPKQSLNQNEPIAVGDSVKYGLSKGVVLAINKKEATINSNGISLRVPLYALKKYHNNAQKPAPSVRLSVQKPKSASVSLDLHGLRVDEALEQLDKFISDALLAGFSEVSVFHGMGTGRLARAVSEFLKAHPSVESFSDAPANAGGYGAKIVRL